MATLTHDVPVRVALPPFSIEGTLSLPEEPRGIVVFAQGSGATRLGRRDRLVRTLLEEAGFGTLPLDLVTPDEGQVDEGTRLLWWDIHLLAGRLAVATDWLVEREDTEGLPLGYLGVGAGASVALAAASARSSAIRAVVSIGGRLDLVASVLPSVTTPTLLIAEKQDEMGVRLDRHALELLAAAEKELRVVSEVEGDALEQVAGLAASWFARHFRFPV